MAHFDSLNPATGDVIASHEIYEKAQVDSAVQSAHEAKLKWQKLGFNGRKKVLQNWKGVIAKRTDEIAQLIAEETGKPFGDAKLEVSVAISHLAWASGKAGYYLKEQRYLI